jgi:hypothetical protein
MIIAFEKSIRNDVMHIKQLIITNPSIAAFLAGVVVAFSCLARLSTPIWSSACNYFAIHPVRVAFANHVFRQPAVFAFIRAEATFALFCKHLMNGVSLVALLARYLNIAIGSTGLCLWLSGCELRTALIRAESALTIRPVYELGTAPTTNERSLFGWVRLPLVLIGAFLRAVFTPVTNQRLELIATGCTGDYLSFLHVDFHRLPHMNYTTSAV